MPKDSNGEFCSAEKKQKELDKLFYEKPWYKRLFLRRPVYNPEKIELFHKEKVFATFDFNYGKRSSISCIFTNKTVKQAIFIQRHKFCESESRYFWKDLRGEKHELHSETVGEESEKLVTKGGEFVINILMN